MKNMYKKIELKPMTDEEWEEHYWEYRIKRGLSQEEKEEWRIYRWRIKRKKARSQTVFLEACEKCKDFNNNQMEEICWGFQGGLTVKQVKLYATPEFDNEQMCKIREGFMAGLTMEQVKIYAKPEFNAEQMRQIGLLLMTEDTEFVKRLVKNKNNFDFYVALAM